MRWVTNALVRKAAGFLLLLQLTPFTAFAASPLIDDLNMLIQQGRFQEAYALAQEGLFENEGDPEFDFLYGLSALESDQPDEAVFAFERIAFTYPNQQRVKLELARAYYMSNNLAAAEDVFNEVLETNPTPNVVNNINAFLEIIEERQNSTATTFTWYLNSNLGNDSNINSATDLGIISTPIGDVELNAGGKSIEDTYMDLGGGFTYTYPLDKNSNLALNGVFSRHNNFDTNKFDIDTMLMQGSYAVIRDNDRYSGSLRYQKVLLDGTGFQRSASLVGAWQHNAGNGWNQSLTGALTAVRYFNTDSSPNNELRDINQTLVSGVVGKVTGNFIHNVSVYFADEDILRDQGKNNAKSFYGFAITQQYQLMPGHIPFLRLSLNKSDHKKADPVFNLEREDETFSATLGWLWQLNNRMNINSDITYTDNESNITLYEYDRVKYQTGIRYQF